MVFQLFTIFSCFSVIVFLTSCLMSRLTPSSCLLFSTTVVVYPCSSVFPAPMITCSSSHVTSILLPSSPPPPRVFSSVSLSSYTNIFPSVLSWLWFLSSLAQQCGTTLTFGQFFVPTSVSEQQLWAAPVLKFLKSSLKVTACCAFRSSACVQSLHAVFKWAVSFSLLRRLRK